MDSHSCHVPENEHEPELLVEHVPRLRDHVLGLGASVDIKSSTGQEHNHVSGDSSHLFVLLDGPREGDQEEQDPGDSYFGKHLQVDNTDSRVKGGAHENVV